MSDVPPEPGEEGQKGEKKSHVIFEWSIRKCRRYDFTQL